MDNTPFEKGYHNDSEQHYPAHQFPLPTISSPRLSSSSGSSLDSQGSKVFAHVHPPTPPDMDSAGDARRRKALMKHANGSIADTLQTKSKPRRQRRKDGNGSKDLSGRKHMIHSSDDGESSDFSSWTTSDDVELSNMSSENDFTDDEEAALAKKDIGRRKRKRRRNTLLKQRVIGVPSVSKPEHDSADRSVIKALLINSLLIASWYAFSLSISIVSPESSLNAFVAADGSSSIISGCSRTNSLISTTLYSRPACTCLFNLP